MPNRSFSIYRSGLGLVFFLGLLAGCGFEGFPSPGDYDPNTVSVVLTFDDGPVSADVANPEEVADHESLLAPLDRILGKLQNRNATGVFYIKGPGTPEAEDALQDVFAHGILSIHQAGQIMGYHAYNHDDPIWKFPANTFCMNKEPMKEDLLRLKRFLGRIGGLEGLAEDDILTPVFRQPFGGTLVGIGTGAQAARELGLTYHAYWIDSFDWTGHADVDPSTVAHLPVATEADHVAFVRQRFRERAKCLTATPVIDVLLHVNSFTAAHLDEWMDELKTDFEEFTGKPVLFNVPETYLVDNQVLEDMTILTFLF